jgi:hypothetical protein
MSLRNLSARERWAIEWRRVRKGRPPLRGWHGASVAASRMPLRYRDPYAQGYEFFGLASGIATNCEGEGFTTLRAILLDRTRYREGMIRSVREHLAHLRSRNWRLRPLP